MKILALVIILILLIKRIKDTPVALSKHLYNKRIEKYIEKMENSFESIKDEETLNVSKTIIVLSVFFIELFLAIFYAILGTKIGTIEFIIMSVLEIFICIYNAKILFTGKVFSPNVEDYKFHRLFNLFDVILDYIYYISAICILLK